ncbi:DUF397 domain-containing protein [Yinghuangia sp. YIM S10712]|uniref:DUF397 domain-containing protein n=1 Tax=Yinghuangia sp. YIM S10712 TaxID=3436930 RepID=UPI003F534BF3
MYNSPPQAPSWRKSSYSGQVAQECVEVASLDSVIGARDSKDAARGHLTVSPAAWTALTETIKR